MTELVSPFPRDSAPRIFVWAEKLLDRLFDDGTPREADAFTDYWLKIIDESGTWGVLVDGELAGIIVAQPQMGAMRISSVFKPCAFGKADSALRQVYGELFEAGADQLQSAVFAFNQSLISLLCRLGARGVADFHHAAQINGRPRKLVLFVTTKESFYAIPSTGDGRAVGGQRDRLSPRQPVQNNQAEAAHRQHAHV